MYRSVSNSSNYTNQLFLNFKNYKDEKDKQRKEENREKTKAFWNACSKILIINLITLTICAGVGLGVGFAIRNYVAQLYGASCGKNSDCQKISDYGFYCINEVCSCSNMSYYLPSAYKCMIKKSNFDFCDSTVLCNNNLGLKCNNSKCVCTGNTLWDGNSCQPGYSGAKCNSTSQCQTKNGLYCSGNGTCECINSNRMFWDGFKCIPKLNYTLTCASSNDCDDSLNLICQTSSSACDCPITSKPNMCDCDNGFYYDFDLGTCAPLKLNNESCISNYQCKSSASLSCVSGSCICPNGSQWFWSDSSKNCVQCPIGWIIYSSHCYYVNTTKTTWYQSLKLCEEANSTLMIVNDKNEYNLLYNFYLQYAKGGGIWIGSNSTIPFQYRWIDNITLDRYSYMWCPNQPDNWGGGYNFVSEGCVHMVTLSGKICLNDFSCSGLYSYCCEMS